MYKEQLDTIDRANAFLQQCTSQSILLEPPRSKRRSRHTKAEFKSIRKHATSLYNVIVKGNCWKCECKDRHVASLRLEARPRTIKDSTAGFCFRLLLCKNVTDGDTRSMSDWRGITVEPEPATLSRVLSDGLGVMDDICAKIFPLTIAEERIGYLHENVYSEYRHRVDLTDAKLGSKFRTKSLDQLLNSGGQGPPQYFLSRRHRLNIAAILASSVLQLDQTSWLKSQWKSNDICFHYRDEDTVLTSKPTFPPPHVACRLSDSNSEPNCAVESPLPRAQHARSEALLTLGLALVELCFGRTLEKMQIPEDVDQNENLTRLNTAIRKLDEVYNESGGHYGDVVRRCLYCSFDVRDASLDDEEFEQDVFDYVVTPLIEDIEVFDGGR